MTNLETLPIRAQETRKYEIHLVGPKHSADLSQSERWALVDEYRYPSLRDNRHAEGQN
jgi:hypothetical protein